jgi:hypothetical protein
LGDGTEFWIDPQITQISQIIWVEFTTEITENTEIGTEEGSYGLYCHPILRLWKKHFSPNL